MISIDLLKYQSNKLLIYQYIYRELFRKELTIYLTVKHRITACWPLSLVILMKVQAKSQIRILRPIWQNNLPLVFRPLSVQFVHLSPESSLVYPSTSSLFSSPFSVSLQDFKISLWKIFQILKWHILVLTYYRKVTWLEKIK